MAINEPNFPPAGLSGTVLCIEDNPVNMELIETALSMYPGITLLKAYDRCRWHPPRTRGASGPRAARHAPA
jgi:hypothetical protein